MAVTHTSTDPAVDAVMSAVEWPSFIVRRWYELGRDSTGEPSAWIWLILSDAGWEERELLELQLKLRRRFFDAGLPYWPYVHVRTAAEQKALEGLKA